LQRVHQTADRADQFTGACELVEFVDFAAPGRHKKAES